MAIEMIDLPIKNGIVFAQLCKRLPEGTSPISKNIFGNK
jgi:hypothetical protein